MNSREIIHRLLYGEVDTVNRGADRLLSMQEREQTQELERQRLRALAHQEHPLLAAAVRRRRRLMRQVP